jgi:hypothetical protein
VLLLPPSAPLTAAGGSPAAEGLTADQFAAMWAMTRSANCSAIWCSMPPSRAESVSSLLKSALMLMPALGDLSCGNDSGSCPKFDAHSATFDIARGRSLRYNERQKGKRMKRQTIICLLFALILAALLLSACGSDDGSSQVELVRRVSLVNGFVRVQLPEGWLADENGETVIFANNQAGLGLIEGGLQAMLDNVVSRPEDLPPDTQIGVMIISEVFLGNTDYTVGSLLEDEFTVEGSPFPPGLIREVRLNGRDAALAPIEFVDSPLNGLLAEMDWQGVVVTLIGIWSPDSDDQIGATYEAILAQMEIDVGGLTSD